MLARLAVAATLVVAATLPPGAPDAVPAAAPGDAGPTAAGTAVFINEIHYENRGPDTGEMVEVAGPPGTDLSGFSVVLYDAEGTAYATDALQGTIGDNGVVVVDYPVEGVRNGPSGAVALVDADTVRQFLSWGGAVTAADGPVSGRTSTVISQSEGAGTTPGSSLQLTGTGDAPQDFAWSAPAEATPGGPNDGQSLTQESVAPSDAAEASRAELLEPGDIVSEMVPPSDPAVERIVEGESLAGTATGTPTSVQTSSGVIVWSENRRLRVDAIQVGDATTLTLQVPEDGRYALGADLTTGPDHATVTLAVDDKAVGSAFDGYSSADGLQRRVSLGEVDLATGAHTITITVTGRADASTGWLAGLDLLRLRQLPAEGGRLTLTPHEGDALRGNVPFYGWSTQQGDDLRLRVDGQDIVDWASLGDGATLLYEAQGIQAGPAGADFADGIRVRGQDTVLHYDVGAASTEFATDGIDIAGELLRPGDNPITVFTGPDPAAGPDSNMDDFKVRNVRLVLADGTVLRDPAKPGTYTLKDTAPESVFTFVIPEPAEDGPRYPPARGYVWDTSTVEDGEHTVELVAAGSGGDGSGERLTSTVTVDNGVPTISGLTPADGSTLKGEAVLGATVDDGDAGPPAVTATLDGADVELGTTVHSDDLTDGGHTFTVTATDSAGNTATVTSSFTSIRQTPDAPQLLAPEDGATGVPTNPELTVRANDPAGDPLKVTFLEAIPVAGPPRTAVGGSTTGDAPSPMVPTGSTKLDARSVATSDDRYADAAETSDFPYQRYDIRVTDPKRADSVDVSWEGRLAPDREIAVSVYDLVDQAWTEVAAGRGTDDADTTVVGVARLDRTLDKDVVHVLVQGRDPFPEIPTTADATFDDPADYDFSIAWTTDTQYLSQGAEAGKTSFADAYRGMNRWIVDNAAQRKIAYAAHTGDLINDWVSTTDVTPEYRARADREFQFASETMAVLDDAGIPNGVTPGNHDNRTGLSNDLYNEYFPPSRYDAAEDTAPKGDDGEGYYGGAWKPDDNQNHFDLIEAAGQKLIFVYVGYIVGPDEIAWANQVLADHRDRKAVVLTHSYLLPSMAPDGGTGELTTDDGINLFEQVVMPNENVFLTLSGHTHGVALNIKRDAGAKGRTIVEMLANYQFFEVQGERRTGFLRLLQFNTKKSQVSVNTYSPVLDDQNAVEFDTQVGRAYVRGADEFVVPVDLSSRTTGFRTDAVGLALRTEKVIGTASVASGDEATVTWPKLRPQTSYGWYARATDEFSAAAESTAFTFTTGKPTKPPKPGGQP